MRCNFFFLTRARRVALITLIDNAPGASAAPPSARNRAASPEYIGHGHNDGTVNNSSDDTQAHIYTHAHARAHTHIHTHTQRSSADSEMFLAVASPCSWPEPRQRSIYARFCEKRSSVFLSASAHPPPLLLPPPHP